MPAIYNEIVKTLKKELIFEEDLEQMYAQAFRNRYQGPNETVGAYVLALRKLAIKAFGEGVATGNILESQFWTGINGCLRTALIHVEKEDFKD